MLLNHLFSTLDESKLIHHLCFICGRRALYLQEQAQSQQAPAQRKSPTEAGESGNGSTQAPPVHRTTIPGTGPIPSEYSIWLFLLSVSLSALLIFCFTFIIHYYLIIFPFYTLLFNYFSFLSTLASILLIYSIVYKVAFIF